MLHRGAARFAGELGKAGLMHTMPTRRIKAGCAGQTSKKWGIRGGLKSASPIGCKRWTTRCRRVSYLPEV
jgi:hypothetical protein